MKTHKISGIAKSLFDFQEFLQTKNFSKIGVGDFGTGKIETWCNGSKTILIKTYYWEDSAASYREKLEGWDVFRPVTEHNSVSKTKEAVTKYLVG